MSVKIEFAREELSFIKKVSGHTKPVVRIDNTNIHAVGLSDTQKHELTMT